MEFALLTFEIKQIQNWTCLTILLFLILHMPVYTLKSVLRLLFQRVLQGQQNLRSQIKKNNNLRNQITSITRAKIESSFAGLVYIWGKWHAKHPLFTINFVVCCERGTETERQCMFGD